MGAAQTALDFGHDLRGLRQRLNNGVEVKEGRANPQAKVIGLRKMKGILSAKTEPALEHVVRADHSEDPSQGRLGLRVAGNEIASARARAVRAAVVEVLPTRGIRGASHSEIDAKVALCVRAGSQQGEEQSEHCGEVKSFQRGISSGQ